MYSQIALLVKTFSRALRQSYRFVTTQAARLKPNLQEKIHSENVLYVLQQKTQVLILNYYYILQQLNYNIPGIFI